MRASVGRSATLWLFAACLAGAIVEHRDATAGRGQRQDRGLAPVAVPPDEQLGEAGERGDLLGRLENAAFDPLGFEDRLYAIVARGAHLKLFDHHVGDECRALAYHRLQDAEPALPREVAERPSVEDERLDGVHG